MDVAFEKWHGCKNDFIVVWVKPNQDEVFASLKRQAVRLCSRNGEGLGADGILVLHMATHDDLLPPKMTVINSDGSLAKNCGNGLRCAAQSILKRNLEEGHREEVPEGVEISIEGKPYFCRYMGRTNTTEKSRQYPMIAVEIGVPVHGQSVSFAEKFKEIFANASLVLKTPLPKNYKLVELGNPHVVFPFDEVSRELINEIGPALQKGWDGINVHIISTKELTDEDKTKAANRPGVSVEDLYEVWTWERGAGFTQACGSGASAVAASLFKSGECSRSDWVAIDMPGGRLYCQQDEEDDPVILAGPAEYVARGFLEV
jgi:diaminopimelate epimerase